MARLTRRYPLAEALIKLRIAPGHLVDLEAYNRLYAYMKANPNNPFYAQMKANLEHYPFEPPTLKKHVSPQCIETRRQRGSATRAEILKEWRRLSHLPERERATKIAARLKLSEQHIRRVIKAHLK
jgi:hypothetical protein